MVVAVLSEVGGKTLPLARLYGKEAALWLPGFDGLKGYRTDSFLLLT